MLGLRITDFLLHSKRENNVKSSRAIDVKGTCTDVEFKEWYFLFVNIASNTSLYICML